LCSQMNDDISNSEENSIQDEPDFALNIEQETPALSWAESLLKAMNKLTADPDALAEIEKRVF
jgi:hypothetical protein